MRFVIDAQLPPALAALLKDHGYEADHVESIGLRDADDTSIWNFALKHMAIIVTKDEDFPHRQKQGKAAPVIIWLRIGNTSHRGLIEWFNPLLPQLVALIEQGDRLIEVRK